MAIAGIAIAAALLVPRLMPDYSEGIRVLIVAAIAIDHADKNSVASPPTLAAGGVAP
jgi:hypothetical protein